MLIILLVLLTVYNLFAEEKESSFRIVRGVTIREGLSSYDGDGNENIRKRKRKLLSGVYALYKTSK